MSETMVERVARAVGDIAVNGGCTPNEMALVAIKAMREPTEGMLEASLIHSTVQTKFTAMIDAAIAEAERT